jgi:hypothetical protein
VEAAILKIAVHTKEVGDGEEYRPNEMAPAYDRAFRRRMQQNRHQLL